MKRLTGHAAFSRVITPLGAIAPALFIALFAAALRPAQTQPQRPLTFDAATVRPVELLQGPALVSGRAGTKIDASRVDMTSITLFRLICIAYRVRPWQIKGPAWLSGEMYDLHATLPAGATTDQVPDMLRVLLIERFKLAAHRETSDQNAYALLVANGGPKMRESVAATDPASNAPRQQVGVPTLVGDVTMSPAQGPRGQTVALSMPSGEIPGKVVMTFLTEQGGPQLHLATDDMTMKTFAELLSLGPLDKPAVDLTGLNAHYQIEIDLSRDEAMGVIRTAMGAMLPIPAGSDPSGSAIRDSITKLGLRLESRKLPLDMIVVDSVEKTPTEN